ncbi:MAG: hypothetical protein ACR2IK_07485 [Chloroflexota bacterium]
MDLEVCLGHVDAALADADAELSTDLGDSHEVTRARLWRHQVLIDWEPDSQAGGCLLRPDLVRRLVALKASVKMGVDGFRISAPGRIVAALSVEHADLVGRLGGARRVEMHATLRFQAEVYRGGQETYYLVEHGHRQALLRLSADVRPRQVGGASPRTSPAPT